MVTERLRAMMIRGALLVVHCGVAMEAMFTSTENGKYSKTIVILNTNFGRLVKRTRTTLLRGSGLGEYSDSLYSRADLHSVSVSSSDLFSGWDLSGERLKNPARVL